MIPARRHRGQDRLIRGLIWVLGWMLLSMIPRVAAHPFLQDSWWVVMEERRILCRVTATLREITIARGRGTGSGTPRLEELLEWIPHYGPTLMRSISIVADGKPLPVTVLDARLEAEGAEGPGPDSPFFLDQTHAVFDLECEVPGPVRDVEFRQQTLKGSIYAPGTPWDVTYSLLIRDSKGRELGAGIVRADLPYHLVLGEEPAPAVDPGPDSPAPVPAPRSRGTGMPPVLDYLRLGIHHILHGYDHLLFLAALVLAMPPIRVLLAILLAFTLAHSITITLAALQWVRVPSAIVEPLIAGSIVVVALMNLLERRPDKDPRRVWIAFGFGLVHGLGFAGGLGEALGTASGWHVALAIGAFCLGVEIGHVCLGVPGWGLLRAGRFRWGLGVATTIRCAGSVVVAVGGIVYLIAALRQAF